MASTISDIDCPRCKGEAVEDFYYKTNEVFIFCPNCGYRSSFEWKRDENGKLELADPTKPFSFDNLIEVHTEIKEPYGVFSIESKLGGCSLGTIIDDEDYQKFLVAIKETIDIAEHPISKVIVRHYVNNESIEEIVYQAKEEDDNCKET